MARLAGACTTAFLVSVLSCGPASGQADPSHLKIKSEGAVATFVTTDPSDLCNDRAIETIVNINVQE